MINFRPSTAVVFVLLIIFSEGLTEDSIEDDESASRQKRSFDMARLGRGLHMLRLGKRGFGRSSPQEDLSLDDLDYLYNLVEHDLGYDSAERKRRSVPEYEDIKQEDFENVEDWQKEYLENENVGKDLGETGDEYYETEKRGLNMLRLGKRPMSMLRLGKRPMSMLRLGKRPMSMLRLGKRPMSMLRLGKRPMGMLRLGKRPMSMLRLGKRPMSMLRLGKRPMSMLRLGKRPMSMLRLGKRSDEQVPIKDDNSS